MLSSVSTLHVVWVVGHDFPFWVMDTTFHKLFMVGIITRYTISPVKLRILTTFLPKIYVDAFLGVSASSSYTEPRKDKLVSMS